MSLIYLPEDALKARVREVENARKNRAEIVKAYSHGQVSRSELIKWSLMSGAGALAPIAGLSPFAQSAYAAGTSIPTGAPRSPLFGAQAFSQPMPRFDVLLRGNRPLTGDLNPVPTAQSNQTLIQVAAELGGGYGPCEGRPPGPIWAHQQFSQFPPQVSVANSDLHPAGRNVHPP